MWPVVEHRICTQFGAVLLVIIVFSYCTRIVHELEARVLEAYIVSDIKMSLFQSLGVEYFDEKGKGIVASDRWDAPRKWITSFGRQVHGLLAGMACVWIGDMCQSWWLEHSKERKKDS